MEILHRQDGTHGEFYIDENGQTIAQFSYSMMDDATMIATHTGVSPRLRGQGIAMKLVEFATQYAREHHLKIVPSCSYVRWAYETYPELGEGVVK